jgi:DNA-directed RNA polymerase specialized sigma24 family protein
LQKNFPATGRRPKKLAIFCLRFYNPNVMLFPETRWTMLAQATLHGDATGRAALEELCRRYWPAVRDVLRARGFSAEEAEDVSQDFFHELLRSSAWHRAEPAKGKFRTFLLGALEHTLIDRHRHRTRQKRGGGQAECSLDAVAEPGVVDEARCFDTAWAERVLEMALDTLEQEMTAAGRAAEFAVLLPFLGAPAADAASQTAATHLGLSPSALKTRIFRLRQSFRENILREINRTVATPHEAEQEMAYLFEVVSQPGFAFAPIVATAGPV